jgi:hypothetical protein
VNSATGGPATQFLIVNSNSAAQVTLFYLSTAFLKLIMHNNTHLSCLFAIFGQYFEDSTTGIEDIAILSGHLKSATQNTPYHLPKPFLIAGFWNLFCIFCFSHSPYLHSEATFWTLSTACSFPRKFVSMGKCCPPPASPPAPLQTAENKKNANFLLFLTHYIIVSQKGSPLPSHNPPKTPKQCNALWLQYNALYAAYKDLRGWGIPYSG